MIKRLHDLPSASNPVLQQQQQQYYNIHTNANYQFNINPNINGGGATLQRMNSFGSDSLASSSATSLPQTPHILHNRFNNEHDADRSEGQCGDIKFIDV